LKIINAQAGSETMTEEETKDFLSNNANNLLMRIGTIDEKGEPNVSVTAFYFDEPSEKIFLATQKDSKKVQHLKNRNILSYCIDQPNPPYTGVRGKGTVKFLVNVQENIPLAKKYLTKLTGSLDNQFAKWLMNEIQNGTSIFLEITPRYFSTWRIPGSS
jgi:general stress protein 26